MAIILSEAVDNHEIRSRQCGGCPKQSGELGPTRGQGGKDQISQQGSNNHADEPAASQAGDDFRPAMGGHDSLNVDDRTGKHASHADGEQNPHG